MSIKVYFQASQQGAGVSLAAVVFNEFGTKLLPATTTVDETTWLQSTWPLLVFRHSWTYVASEYKVWMKLLFATTTADEIVVAVDATIDSNCLVWKACDQGAVMCSGKCNSSGKGTNRRKAYWWLCLSYWWQWQCNFALFFPFYGGVCTSMHVGVKTQWMPKEFLGNGVETSPPWLGHWMPLITLYLLWFVYCEGCTCILKF